MNSLVAMSPRVIFQGVVFSGIGASLFFYLFDELPVNAAVPLIPAVIFFLPIAFLYGLVQPTGALVASEKITASEITRLKDKVKVIQFYLKLTCLILFFSGLVGSLLIYFAQNKLLDIQTVMTIVGGMLGFEVYSIIKLLVFNSNLHNHAATVAERFEKMKHKRKQLKDI